MLPHPTRDSAKSSPNGRLSCPTQYCFFFGCSQLAFFHDAQTLDQPVYRVIVCSPESTPDAGIFFFFGVVTKINQTTLFIVHFVLQTADTTGHNRFTLLDARGPPQSSTLLRCHLRGTIAAWSPVSRVGNSPTCPSTSPCSLYILWEDDRATSEAGKNCHPRT